mmetsp:Transcript_35672/g.112573  ORF Transcript_35672/g.112573 Transcript_35672/m.112573 type:complete len:269 (-) Transcript_35672:58-864(-)
MSLSGCTCTSDAMWSEVCGLSDGVAPGVLTGVTPLLPMVVRESPDMPGCTARTLAPVAPREVLWLMASSSLEKLSRFSLTVLSRRSISCDSPSLSFFFPISMRSSAVPVCPGNDLATATARVLEVGGPSCTLLAPQHSYHTTSSRVTAEDPSAPASTSTRGTRPMGSWLSKPSRESVHDTSPGSSESITRSLGMLLAWETPAEMAPLRSSHVGATDTSLNPISTSSRLLAWEGVPSAAATSTRASMLVIGRRAGATGRASPWSASSDA